MQQLATAYGPRLERKQLSPTSMHVQGDALLLADVQF